MAKTVHVYRSSDGWAVKRVGGKSSDVFNTQKEAIDTARSLVKGKSAPGQVVVYGLNGRIREHVTYGLPRVQNPPGKRGSAKRIQKAVGRVVLERFASDPHPPRA